MPKNGTFITQAELFSINDELLYDF